MIKHATCFLLLISLVSTEDSSSSLLQEYETRCKDIGGFFFDGQCTQDVYEDAICGEDALGERLYVGEDGEVYCDCDEGWVRFNGKCYQEFTPAFCPTVGEILKLNSPPVSCKGLCYPLELKIFLEGMKRNFSCIWNPCPASSYPHWYCFQSEFSTSQKFPIVAKDWFL